MFSLGWDRVGVSNVVFRVLIGCFEVLFFYFKCRFKGSVAGSGISEDECFALGVTISEDGRMEQPIPE